MAPNASQIGEWLRDARKRQGQYSQEQAAHEVGTTARTVYSWEKGEAAPPIDMFLRLAALYKADPAPFLVRHERPVNPPANSHPLRDHVKPKRRRKSRGA